LSAYMVRNGSLTTTMVYTTNLVDLQRNKKVARWLVPKFLMFMFELGSRIF
jgi:hypothetical protein